MRAHYGARRIRRDRRGRGKLTLALMLAGGLGVLALASCYQNSPTAPFQPPPRPTTTTTTTTMVGPTTTTAGLVDYASQVHPIWADQGCTACHSGGPAPELGGSPTDSCNGLATQDAASPNLIITGGGAANSLILAKPNPGGVSHVGGGFPCFAGAGADCYDVVLRWLQQGANGPGGSTCGG